MDIFALLTLIGGLAFFLYGMNIMGKGLETLSGSRLQGILEKMTSSTVKGVLLGLVVTAIIQSSSATTVMVVGFVNSGIMQLSQAVGVIMGANIGTTATAWILSLTSIQGDSLILQMLKPSSFTPILAMIGVILTMLPTEKHYSGRKKDVGTILIGFSILDLWYGGHERSGEASVSVPAVCRDHDSVFQSVAGRTGRIGRYGNHPELFGNQRNSAGPVNDGTDDLWGSNSHHHGSEYRNLCYSADFQYRSQEERKAGSDDPSVFQSDWFHSCYGGILWLEDVY